MSALVNRLRLRKIQTSRWARGTLGEQVWSRRDADGREEYYLCHRSEVLSTTLTDLVDIPDSCKTLYLVWTPMPVQGYVNGRLDDYGGVNMRLDGGILRPVLMGEFEQANAIRYDNGMRYVHVEFEEESDNV